MNTTFDFGDGPVPAKQHPNGGGWVADTATVSDNAFVGPRARVFGTARVSGNAHVFGNAWVFGNARVYDTASVCGNARVYGNALVSGDARVSGNARVYGNACVSFTPPRASRSDGYDFIVVPDSTGTLRVLAGCRYFTFEEARTHWTQTRSGTSLGKETMDILDYLEIRAEKVYKENTQ